MLDLLIYDGIVITMSGKGAGMITNGAVGIKGSEIVCVGDSELIKRQYNAKRKINAKGKAIMPGFVNTHTHSASTLNRGVLADIELYLEQGLAGFLETATIGNLIASTKLHILEGIKRGITTFCDNTVMLEEVAPVYELMGARTRISSCVREMSWDFKDMLDGVYTFDRSFAEDGIKDTIKALDKYGTDPNDRISCMVSPQALDYVSEELMIEFREIAKKHKAMIHMHLAQTEFEITQCKKRYGLTPVGVLEKMGLLNSNTLAAHLVFNTHEDNLKAAEAGLNMAFCPCSFGPKGQIPPAPEYVAAGGIVGIGTDEASFNCVSMMDEMKSAVMLAGVNSAATKSPILPAWKILRMSTVEAAQAVGLKDQVGSLVPGKKADIIMLDLSATNFSPLLISPLSNIVQNIIYSSTGNEVETVIIDGKIIMEGRKVLTIDEKSVLQEAQKEADIASKAAYEYYKKLDESEVLEQQKYY